MKKVVFFTDTNKIIKAYENFNIDSFKNKEFPFKLHMGEIKNKYFPKPKIVKPFIDELKNLGSKPYFYDTTVAYTGLRHTKLGYRKLAKIHGYNKLGYNVKIDDKGEKVEIKNYDFEVADTIYNSTNIFSFSHVKGHIAVGFGGAIKNFGMGGVTKETKLFMHHASKPEIKKDKCTFCGICAEVCPFNAITVKNNSWKHSNRKCFGCGVCVDNCKNNGIVNQKENLQYLLACSCYACVKDKNVVYINDVNRISKLCDCDPGSGPILCPDIGFLVSDDPVAIDMASLDLINDIKPDIFLNENKVDPYKQVKYGEEIGLGTTKYQLLEI